MPSVSNKEKEYGILNIRIDSETKSLLDSMSEKTGLSMSGIVRFLVRNFIHLVFPKKEAKQ